MNAVPTSERMDASSMEGLVGNANRVLQKAVAGIEPPPRNLFKECYGIILMSSIEVGFVFSANLGNGICMSHDPSSGRWSRPVAMGLTGVGFGALAGGESKDLVIFIMEEQMMKTVSANAHFKLGLQVSGAIGPVSSEVGLSVQASEKGYGPLAAFTYARGFFGGVSIESAVVSVKIAVNKKFYPDFETPEQILFENEGFTPSLRDLDRLYERLSLLSGEG